MRLSTSITSFVFLLLASISINASAQSSVCTWVSVYGYISNNNQYISWNCQLPGGTVAASRQDTYSLTWYTYTCGSVNVVSGYQNTGTPQGTAYPQNCNTNIVAANTPTPPVTPTVNPCYTGSSQVIQTSPGTYTPFNPAFCGPQPQCKHSVTPLDPYSYPRLKYTCL